MASAHTVENIVASAFIADSLDLAKVASKVEGVEYNVKRFPGAMLRLADPSHMVLLFPNGKVVTHGSRSLSDAAEAVSRTVGILAAKGFKGLSKKPPLEVQNIVASSSVGDSLSLETLATKLPSGHVELEAEQFPGLIYRMPEPNVVLLVFDTGKVVVTGARTEDEVTAALARLTAEMEAVTVS